MKHITDQELMHRLEAAADALFDGHVTIMRFTTNWRVGFHTPFDYFDIQTMAVGRTFAEAARRALAELPELLDAHREAKKRKHGADMQALDDLIPL